MIAKINHQKVVYSNECYLCKKVGHTIREYSGDWHVWCVDCLNEIENKIAEAFSKPLPTVIDRIKKHIKRNQSFYIQASGMTVAFMVAGFDISLAATSQTDKVGYEIYRRICNIGKWIVIIKGSIDIIGSMSNGDLDTMKKQFIKYVVGFIALLALPWVLDQATAFFEDQSMSTIAPVGDGK